MYHRIKKKVFNCVSFSQASIKKLYLGMIASNVVAGNHWPIQSAISNVGQAGMAGCAVAR